jgi:hypothetical protein
LYGVQLRSGLRILLLSFGHHLSDLAYITAATTTLHLYLFLKQSYFFHTYIEYSFFHLLAMAPIIAQLSCLALLASTTLAAASPLKLDFTRERTNLARRANGDLNLALDQNQQQNSYIIKLSVGTPAQVSSYEPQDEEAKC